MSKVGWFTLLLQCYPGRFRPDFSMVAYRDALIYNYELHSALVGTLYYITRNVVYQVALTKL